MARLVSLKTSLKKTNQRLILILAVFVILFAGFGCKTVSKEAKQLSQPVELKWWSVFGDYDALAPLVAEYRLMHPNVSVDYRKLSFEEYESTILSAMSEDRGPDILSLHNTWLREWQDRLAYSPSVLKMAFIEIQGKIKKEKITVVREVAGVSTKQVVNNFLDVVSGDVILPVPQSDPRMPPISKVFGLPLSIDTLVMYYNRDMLDAAEIAQPAQYWSEFQKQVMTLTQLDSTGSIVQSAVPLGVSSNIERAGDILSLLMLQNGTPMTDQSGAATFNRYTEETLGQLLPPGAVALVFYNDFANPLKEVYTWNLSQPDSYQAFLEGKAAYFFGYAYHLPLIRAQNPELNLGISPFPQIEGNKPINYANYWIETVSHKSEHVDEAWDFINFITRADQAKRYLSKAARPTALRQLVNSQLEEADMSVFASQLPSATSWYKGKDGQASERVMMDMISQMLEPEADPQNILELGAVKINQTLN